jgi:hypothetical protein
VLPPTQSVPPSAVNFRASFDTSFETVFPPTQSTPPSISPASTTAPKTSSKLFDMLNWQDNESSSQPAQRENSQATIKRENSQPNMTPKTDSGSFFAQPIKRENSQPNITPKSDSVPYFSSSATLPAYELPPNPPTQIYR